MAPTHYTSTPLTQVFLLQLNVVGVYGLQVFLSPFAWTDNGPGRTPYHYDGADSFDDDLRMFRPMFPEYPGTRFSCSL
jgi:hypothetical protein